MTEVKTESSVDQDQGRLSRRLRKIAGPAMAILAPVTFIYGLGALRGNPISEKPTVDARLQQILEPTAARLAREVLRENMVLNNNIVVTRPDHNSDTPGAEIVSVEGWDNNQWLTVSATMYRNQEGQLDPTTVNDVDMVLYDCDPAGPGSMCGGGDHSNEEVEIIYGDDSTYTKGNWGIEDDLTPAHEDNPAITINTKVKNPTEISDKPDAQHAITEAKVFSAVAKMWLDEALQGKVQVPQLKDQKAKTSV